MSEKIERRRNSDRREASSQKIIDAAMSLFAEKGYQRTTLIQIGERAGCTGTLVSNRFGNKERVLRAVLAQILNRFEGQKNEGEHEPQSFTATERLGQFVSLYLKDVTEQQTRIRALYVLMGESLGGLPQISEEIQHVDIVFRKEVEEYLQQGIDAKEFHFEGTNEMLAVLIVGMLRGVSAQILNDPVGFSLQEIVTNTSVAVFTLVGAKSTA